MVALGQKRKDLGNFSEAMQLKISLRRFFKKFTGSRSWCPRSIITAILEAKARGHKFKSSLGKVVRPCLSEVKKEHSECSAVDGAPVQYPEALGSILSNPRCRGDAHL